MADCHQTVTKKSNGGRGEATPSCLGHTLCYATSASSLSGARRSFSLLIVPRMWVDLQLFTQPSVAGIRGELSTTEGTVLAWTHFIAADLFVGRWEYLDSREHELSPLVMAPVLFLTAMFCPLGLLLYLAYRAWSTRKA